MCDKLKDGNIPAYMPCPYQQKCEATKCSHLGISHPVAFSCALARAYEMQAELGCKDKCEGCDNCVGAAV